MNKKIKVAFCAAYDWYFLKQALPPVYHEADQILIAIDKDRISWAGKKFYVDEAAFANFLTEIDRDGKIKLYEDDFHRPELSPMQNEVRQRNMMAEAMGQGGWHIQLDTDEYFIDFPGFIAYLKQLSYSRPVNVTCPWLVLFKTVKDGFLAIDYKSNENIDFIAVATNNPKYEFGRRNGYFNIKANYPIVHQSWARNEDEIRQKINNWGHNEDFDVDAYFARWKSLDERNYREFVNFHPINPESWASLVKIEASSISDMIHFLRKHPPLRLSPAYLRKSNSIWRSRINAVLKKIR